MSEVLYWSDEMDRVYHECVNRPVFDHVGTDFSDNVLLGYPYEVVREQIIEKGRADFTTGYDKLSADEKASLYSFINFKKHFYACRLVFETYRDQLAAWTASTVRPMTVDVGCGPGTAKCGSKRTSAGPLTPTRSSTNC
jgi:hypothetical protein